MEPPKDKSNEPVVDQPLVDTPSSVASSAAKYLQGGLAPESALKRIAKTKTVQEAVGVKAN